MQTIEEPAARSRSRHRRRALLLCCAALALAALAGLGVKLWLDRRVPPPDGDPARVARYMASPAFAALPPSQKTPYLEAFQRASQHGDVTPAQQRGVVANMFNRGGTGPIQAYFALPPGKAREHFLDDVIDKQLKLQKEGRLPPAPNGRDFKGIKLDGRGLAESIPPEERAQMDQFMQDLHDRRKARGLPDDGRVVFMR